MPSLSRCEGVVGVCVCVWVEGGWGGWCFPFQGSLGGFPSEGSRMGFLCLLEGRVWGLITGNHANQCLVNSRPVEAFEMSVIYESLTPPKKVLKMNDSDRLQKENFTDFSPILGPITEQNSALIEVYFLEKSASIKAE